MDEIRKRGILLDKLAELETYEYLSELKEPRMRPAVLRTLARFSTSGYTMEQWNYVLSYITSESVAFSTVDELAAFLKAEAAQEDNTLNRSV